MTHSEIESEVRKIKGTWVKRSNARKRFVAESNAEIDNGILNIKDKIRRLKAMGVKEGNLAVWYSQITGLELQKIC